MLDTCRKLTGFVVVLPAQIGKVGSALPGHGSAFLVCMKIGCPKSSQVPWITVDYSIIFGYPSTWAGKCQKWSVTIGEFCSPSISPYHRRAVSRGVIENRSNGNHRFCFQQGFLQTFPSNWFWTLGRPSVWTGAEDRRKGCQGLDLQTFLFWLWIYLLTLRIFASRYKDLRQWYQLTFIFLEWAATTSQLGFTTAET